MGQSEVEAHSVLSELEKQKLSEHNWDVEQQ